MMKHVSHHVTRVGLTGPAVALGVADELHAPTAPAGAPEVAPQMMGLRTTATRPHRRKVTLNRLSAMHG
ncbi:hypothetical protein [Streptomyces chromofuscus]|uniref:Uncharacterized protein n=1 Tax=Streptomyces chromofuscus TaxID=42881 RepID=A0A7M2SZC9_STRCW|nr:hypothetical protein [Streptomyces chromofuscus]QOV41672.1 hypothetical protein IPT68_17155 [Streptomyces chromofuscus]GGT38968.1 hypothetical protein GCM10010254_68720 [Streptomyces chromofuscus]